MGFKILALFWMFLIRWSEVAHTSWDMGLLPRNAVWRTHKESTGLLIYKKCVAHFPGTCALFSQRNFIFHSLPPCVSLAHVCSSSTVISKISSPPLSSHLHPTAQRERDSVGRREIFLNASFSCVEGAWWIWEMVWVLAQMTQCNDETNWKRFPRERRVVVEGGNDMCLFRLFLLFLSLFLSSSLSHSQGFILGWLYRNEVTLQQPHPLNQNTASEGLRSSSSENLVYFTLTCQWGCQKKVNS